MRRIDHGRLSVPGLAILILMGCRPESDNPGALAVSAPVSAEARGSKPSPPPSAEPPSVESPSSEPLTPPTPEELAAGGEILAATFFPRVTASVRKARRMACEEDLKAIHAGCRLIETQTGQWPRKVEDLVNPVDPLTGERIVGGLDVVPVDPWGRDYLYELTEDGPLIRSLGKDGEPGGEGQDADLSYPPPDPDA